jgi:hypothetical protein
MTTISPLKNGAKGDRSAWPTAFGGARAQMSGASPLSLRDRRVGAQEPFVLQLCPEVGRNLAVKRGKVLRHLSLRDGARDNRRHNRMPEGELQRRRG